MLDDGAISLDKYNANVKKITAAYQKQAAVTSNTVLTEGMSALREVYGAEFDTIAKQLNEDLSNFVIEPDDLEASMQSLQRTFEDSIDKAGISSGVKESIKGYMETLMPTADELKKLATEDQSLWKVYGDTLTAVEALKTLTDSGDQMGNAVVSGVNSSSNLFNAEKAGRELKERALKPFSETAKVKIPIEIQYVEKYVPTTEGDKALRNYMPDTFTGQGSAIEFYNTRTYTGDKVKKKNATGTPYFGGGLTRINENGGEIINLPTGAQIIPSDKSAQMVRENAKYRMPNISLLNIQNNSFEDVPYFGRKPQLYDNEARMTFYQSKNNVGSSEKRFGDINININIDGNIIGIENAANEIGERVCEKVVDMVRAI